MNGDHSTQWEVAMDSIPVVDREPDWTEES